MPTYVNNEAANKVVLIGTESVPGVAVVPTAKLKGQLDINETRNIQRTEEATGMYDRFVTLSRDASTFSGTYGEKLTFETFPMLQRYAVAGGGTGVAVPATTTAFRHTKVPSGTVDNIDSFTAQFGVEGLPFQSTGVRFSQFTVSADSTNADNAWMWSSNLFVRDKARMPGGFEGAITAATATTLTVTGETWPVDEYQAGYVFVDYGSGIGQVRQIASNTADTLTLEGPVLDPVPVAGDIIYVSPLLATVSEPDYETITLEGTKLFVDAYNEVASTLGTTDLSDRVLGFNLTEELNFASKRRFSGLLARVSRGARWFTGSVRFEFDRWDEYQAWQDDEEISLRLEKEGSIIEGSTRKRARIDLERVFWDAFTEDTDGNNMTATLTFVAAVPAAQPIVEFETINALANLP